MIEESLVVVCPCNAGELAPLQFIGKVLFPCYTHHLKVGGGWRGEGGGERVEGRGWRGEGGGKRVEGRGWREEGGGERVEGMEGGGEVTNSREQSLGKISVIRILNI